VKGKAIREVLADSAEWLDGEFITVVQQRGAAIIKVRHVCDEFCLPIHVVSSCTLPLYIGDVITLWRSHHRGKEGFIFSPRRNDDGMSPCDDRQRTHSMVLMQRWMVKLL
jgi:hypothetical protein